MLAGPTRDEAAQLEIRNVFRYGSDRDAQCITNFGKAWRVAALSDEVANERQHFELPRSRFRLSKQHERVVYQKTSKRQKKRTTQRSSRERSEEIVFLNWGSRLWRKQRSNRNAQPRVSEAASGARSELFAGTAYVGRTAAATPPE